MLYDHRHLHVEQQLKLYEYTYMLDIYMYINANFTSSSSYYDVSRSILICSTYIYMYINATFTSSSSAAPEEDTSTATIRPSRSRNDSERSARVSVSANSAAAASCGGGCGGATNSCTRATPCISGGSGVLSGALAFDSRPTWIARRVQSQGSVYDGVSRNGRGPPRSPRAGSDPPTAAANALRTRSH